MKSETMSKPTALYRHYDKFGSLLYVGISTHAVSRLSQHRDKPWFDEIADVRVKWLPDRATAIHEERHAIESDGPKYNKTFNGMPAPAKKPAREPVTGRAALFVSLNEAAQELGCTRRFLETRIADGEIRVFRPSKRLVRIRRIDLDNWIDQYSRNV